MHLGLLDFARGCGALVDAQHIPLRIARIPRGVLELASGLVVPLDHAVAGSVVCVLQLGRAALCDAADLVRRCPLDAGDALLYVRG